MINKATCPLCGNPDAESIEALGTKVYGCPCVPENKSPIMINQGDWDRLQAAAQKAIDMLNNNSIKR